MKQVEIHPPIVFIVRAAAMTLAALVAGCAGSGQGLDINGRPVGSADGGPLTADFASIQSHVFTPICTVCHVGGSAPQGLRLDEVNSYAMLVGVSSSEMPSLQRIRPGDPDNSYLIQKLEGHAAVGARMPLGGPYLDQATVAVIRQWVTDGAQSAALAAPGGFILQAAAPTTGDIVGPAGARIILAFSQPLDRNRIDADSLVFERVAAQSGTVLDTVAVALQVPAGNESVLIVTPVLPLPAGRYRLRMHAAPGAGISSVYGEQLGDDVDGVSKVLSDFAVQQ